MPILPRALPILQPIGVALDPSLLERVNAATAEAATTRHKVKSLPAVWSAANRTIWQRSLELPSAICLFSATFAMQYAKERGW